MISPLIKRRQGLNLFVSHPILEDVLKRTYGVILFQEQALGSSLVRLYRSRKRTGRRAMTGVPAPERESRRTCA